MGARRHSDRRKRGAPMRCEKSFIVGPSGSLALGVSMWLERRGVPAGPGHDVPDDGGWPVPARAGAVPALRPPGWRFILQFRGSDSNGAFSNDLPIAPLSQTTVIEQPQEVPRERPELPGTGFSITILEWVFSNQAARDGFREAPTRAIQGFEPSSLFFSPLLSEPHPGLRRSGPSGSESARGILPGRRSPAPCSFQTARDPLVTYASNDVRTLARKGRASGSKPAESPKLTFNSTTFAL